MFCVHSISTLLYLVEQELAPLHGPVLDAVLVLDAQVLGQVARHPHVVYPEESYLYNVTMELLRIIVVRSQGAAADLLGGLGQGPGGAWAGDPQPAAAAGGISLLAWLARPGHLLVAGVPLQYMGRKLEASLYHILPCWSYP